MEERRVKFLESCGLAPSQDKFVRALVSQPRASVLFGGSGYCGKTRTLCVAAVALNLKLAKETGVPPRGFFGCVNYTQVTDRILPQLREMFGHMGSDKTSQGHGWHFAFNDPNLGVICFRNLEDPKHRKGSGFSYVLIDEITELTREMFGDTLYFRLQRTEQKMPFMPLGAATNPDGIGHNWVKSLWVPGYQDFSGENKDFKPSEFVFIPAVPEENPAFDEDAFNTATAGLSESVKKARRTGSWATPEGARWPTLGPQHRFKASEIWPYGIPPHFRKLMGSDYGLRAPYCNLWFAVDGNRDVYCYREDYQAGITADIQAERIQNLTGTDEQIHEWRVDPAYWHKLPGHEGSTDRTIASMYRDVIKDDPRFRCGMAPGYNRSRAIAMATYDMLFNQENNLPNLYIEESCKHFWGELTGAVWDARGMISGKKEDIDPRNPDHAITAGYYALHSFYSPGEESQTNISWVAPSGKTYQQEYFDELSERAFDEFLDEYTGNYSAFH